MDSKLLPVNKILNTDKMQNFAAYLKKSIHDFLKMILKRNNITENWFILILYERCPKLHKTRSIIRKKILIEFGHDHDKQRKSRLP